jgi:hypothetical protein
MRTDDDRFFITALLAGGAVRCTVVSAVRARFARTAAATRTPTEKVLEPTQDRAVLTAADHRAAVRHTARNVAATGRLRTTATGAAAAGIGRAATRAIGHATAGTATTRIRHSASWNSTRDVAAAALHAIHAAATNLREKCQGEDQGQEIPWGHGEGSRSSRKLMRTGYEIHPAESIHPKVSAAHLVGGQKIVKIDRDYHSPASVGVPPGESWVCQV